MVRARHSQKVGLSMKILTASFCFLLLIGIATAQSSVAPNPSAPSVEPGKAMLTIPAGTSIPLSLKQAISTKTAKDGDPYTPDRLSLRGERTSRDSGGNLYPGKVERVQRGGHVKGRAEVLIHFTSMIYPNGYTVMLGGSIENTPGAEKTTMKDSEGTIRQDSDTGRNSRPLPARPLRERPLAALPAVSRESALERRREEPLAWRLECSRVAPT